MAEAAEMAALRRRANQQVAVAELGRRALLGAPIPELMDEACRVVAAELTVEMVKILELQPGEQEFLLVAGVGWREGLVGHERVSASPEYQVGYTVALGEPVVSEDFFQGSRPFTRSELVTSHGARSEASVLIRGAGRPYGVLAAVSQEPRHLSQDDVFFLRGVANVVAQAIERERAVTVLSQREEAQRFLAEASVTLAESLDYQETLTRVAQLAVPRLADWCAVDMRADDGSISRLAVAHTDPAKVAWAWELARRFPPDPDDPQPQGLPEVLRSGRPQAIYEITPEMIATASAANPDIQQVLDEIGLESVLIVPLNARGQTLGALTFAWAESGRHYEARDLALAEDLARRAAAFVDNARLYHQASLARRAAEEAVDRLSRLQEVTSQLSRPLSATAVAAVALGQGREAFGADAGSIYLLDDGELELLASVGYDEGFLGPFHRIPLGRGPVSTAIASAQTVQAESREEMNALWPDVRARQERTADQATVTAPLLIEDRVLGALHFAFHRPRRFSEADLSFVSLIARQTAQALERGRLYDTLEERANAAFVLAHVADGVFQIDGDGEVRYWNQAAERITGVPFRQALGRSIAELLSGWSSLGERVAPDGQLKTLPFEVEGEEMWLALTGVDVGDGQVYAFHNVTAARALEEARRDFVATASHELRTPLAAVYGATQTLLGRDLEPAVQRSMLELIAKECERLERIVEDILLANRLDRGRVELSLRAVLSRPLAREIVALASQRAPDGIELYFSAPDELPPVRADEDRLRQVLTNLVDNAIKYSPGGGAVRLDVRADGGRLHFSVSDQGLGIPQEQLELVFEKFYRLDPQLSRGIGGTGLGLYICRELVRQMRGRIWVESRMGQGSTFHVELPAAGDYARPAGPASPASSTA